MPTPYLPARFLTHRTEGIHLVRFWLNYAASKAGDTKKMVCWLPITKPVTCENSRNFTSDLINPRTDIRYLASFPLTHEMPRECRP